MRNNIDDSLDIRIKMIGGIFLQKYKDPAWTEDISLLNGKGGIALFHALLYQTTGDQRYLDLLIDVFLSIISNIKDSTDLPSPTFCDGLAGIGWLATFLEQLNFLEINSDSFFIDVDLYLEWFLEDKLRENNWDILHGGIGIALYFLKRKKFELVAKMIEYLDETSTTVNNETKWVRYDRNVLTQVYDLGLAHGMASVMYFLTKCYNAEINPAKCAKMITGIQNFYDNNIQKQGEIGSNFCTYITAAEYNQNGKSFSRLAWCYGDLGILYTLGFAAKRQGNLTKAKDIELLLKETLKRRTEEQTNVKDFGICHGSSGLGLIYTLIFYQTGDQSFKSGGAFWLDYTLNQLEQHEFALLEDDEYGLLTGLAGVGIYLLSQRYPELIFNETNNSWMECLFLK